MHHGVNAKAFVHLTVDGPVTVPARSLGDPGGTLRFLTRVGTPVDPASALPPGAVIAADHAARTLAAADAVFEPVETARLRPAAATGS